MARRYPQTYRDKALAMMMASATEEEGEWKPQYRPVATELECSRTTLHRWWAERDVTQDRTLRAASTRARQAIKDEGAETWVDSFYRRSQGVINIILRDCEEPWRPEVDEDGNPAPPTEHSPKVDQKARALKLVSEVVPAVDAHINGTNKTDKGRTTDRLHIICRQALIAGLLTDEDIKG